MKKAVILFSGGLDSTTCVAIAQSQQFDCHALSFDYDQKHRVELDKARQLAQILAIKHQIIKLFLGELGGSALTDSQLQVPDYKESEQIPITYVPARNTIFLANALAYAEVIGAYDIFLGINATDYSNYPDCRPEYVAAFTTLANLATKSAVEGQHITLHAPLITLSKAEIILKGLELGVDYSMTVSCYRLDAKARACGHCDSCFFRKKGFLEAGVLDPTVYVG